MKLKRPWMVLFVFASLWSGGIRSQVDAATIESVTLLAPEQFKNGRATFSDSNLLESERVVLIGVHAKQNSSSGYSYEIRAEGFSGERANLRENDEVDEPDSPDEEGEIILPEVKRHSDFWSDAWSAMTEEKNLNPGVGDPSFQYGRTECKPPYNEGQECEFSILDYEDNFKKETASVRLVTDSFVVFVENRSRVSISNKELRKLIAGFEKRRFAETEKVFGKSTDLDDNGKIFILFSGHLYNSSAREGVMGYVAPWDFIKYRGYPHVGGEIFYLGTPDVYVDAGFSRKNLFKYQYPSTLVHELKHMIAMGRRTSTKKPFEELWLEEPSAVAAEELVNLGTRLRGPQSSSRSQLKKPQDFAIRYSRRPENADENYGMYGMNFLFLWRQAERVGHANFWSRFVDSGKRGLENFELASERSIDSAMLDFAKALFFDHTGLAPEEDFKTINLRDGTWQKLGTASLKNGLNKGRVRSFTYYEAKGQNRPVDIDITTEFNLPYFMVIKYKP